MNPPKVTDCDYIDFLIATPKAYSGVEAARVSAVETSPPAHDAFTRLLLWSDGDRHILIDYRIYDKARDGLSKNDHLQAMLRTAHERGF